MAKILIVDDKVVSDALFVFFTRAGHDVVTASDRVSGLQLFRTIKPALVILDRDLPGFAGKGGLEQLAKFCGKTPVIVLSGCRVREDGEACLRCGAAVYLPKSGGLSPVLNEAERLLGRLTVSCAPATEKKTKPLVLVVDDEAEVCELLGQFLASVGCDVLTAYEATTAEDLVRAHKPDIVLLDIFMPGRSGLEALAVIAREAPGAGIIMLSGNDDEKLAASCLRAGAFEYLQKPLKLDALHSAIKTRLLFQQP